MCGRCSLAVSETNPGRFVLVLNGPVMAVQDLLRCGCPSGPVAYLNYAVGAMLNALNENNVEVSWRPDGEDGATHSVSVRFRGQPVSCEEVVSVLKVVCGAACVRVP